MFILYNISVDEFLILIFELFILNNESSKGKMAQKLHITFKIFIGYLCKALKFSISTGFYGTKSKNAQNKLMYELQRKYD